MTPRMWLKTGIRKIINNQLQWGRESLPGCNARPAWPRDCRSRFNGAGDDSPDVTANVVVRFLYTVVLQWSRGSLPGCNEQIKEDMLAMPVLQWGRGSLPGCNDGIQRILPPI